MFLSTDVVGEINSILVDVATCLTLVTVVFLIAVCASVARKTFERGENLAADGNVVFSATETKAVSSAFLVVDSSS